jgi:hypothetical protein
VGADVPVGRVVAVGRFVPVGRLVALGTWEGETRFGAHALMSIAPAPTPAIFKKSLLDNIGLRQFCLNLRIEKILKHYKSI